jgi:beta-fructofuranosidase
VPPPSLRDIPELAVRAWSDPHRPRFHFVAPAGWLNDPNGLAHWHGRYHLFFQYNPDAVRHERICWGHASSPDLVHWTDEPLALEPGPGPDRDGCWSGVLVDDGGVPTLIYSGHVAGVGQRACLATGDAELRTWRKDPSNPVIPDPPAGLEVAEFRDHCVWRAGDRWQQLVGSGIRGRGGAALLYESADLRAWTYVGPILVGETQNRNAIAEDVWTGSVWECVDLFRLGGNEHPAPDVLVFSVWHEEVTEHSVYQRGDFDGRQFQPASRHHLDLGLNYFYAPQSLRDADGRRVLLGWVQEGRSAAAQVDAGWSGVMSLPRLATMAADGLVEQSPVPGLAALRREPRSYGPLTLSPGETLRLPDAPGDQYDLEGSLTVPPGAGLELLIRATRDGQEQTRIVLADGGGGSAGQDEVRLALDRTASSAAPGLDVRELSGRVPLRPGRRLHLRVLVDHSVLEIFANGRPLTARVYPTRPDATSLAVRAEGGPVGLDQLQSWAMADIWSGPRPPRPEVARRSESPGNGPGRAEQG